MATRATFYENIQSWTSVSHRRWPYVVRKVFFSTNLTPVHLRIIVEFLILNRYPREELFLYFKGRIGGLAKHTKQYVWCMRYWHSFLQEPIFWQYTISYSVFTRSWINLSDLHKNRSAQLHPHRYIEERTFHEDFGWRDWQFNQVPPSRSRDPGQLNFYHPGYRGRFWYE